MYLMTNSYYQFTSTNSVSYALKFINPYIAAGSWAQNESSVLPTLLTMQEHPNILKYFGEFHVYLGGVNNWLVICTELCTGSLQQFLNTQFHQLTEAEHIAGCWDIVRQVLTGLQLCRSNNLMHRDIKLTNGKYSHVNVFN